MDRFFLYGSLLHRPLLDLVLGDSRDVQIAPATLADHAAYQALNAPTAVIARKAGAVVHGLLVGGLGEEPRERLAFYCGFDDARHRVTVTTDEGTRAALVHAPDLASEPAGAPWSPEAWERDWAAISLRAAAEAMAQFGKIDAAELARWLPAMRVRAASWVRAQASTTPQRIRHGFTAADVAVERAVTPYSKFFGLEEQRLRFRRFDGTFSKPVDRAAFVTADAVTVVPYDPVRDRVLLIEQFRFGPHVRGDRHPWCLEPVAGRIDPGETPEVCARRETLEETGVTLSRLERIAAYYPTTGALSEYLFSYIGIADLPDGITGIGGEDSEEEDIRSLLLSFGQLQDLVASPEAENGPLILSALWLAANRSRLRSDA